LKEDEPRSLSPRLRVRSGVRSNKTRSLEVLAFWRSKQEVPCCIQDDKGGKDRVRVELSWSKSDYKVLVRITQTRIKRAAAVSFQSIGNCLSRVFFFFAFSKSTIAQRLVGAHEGERIGS
jgi:hypothetical protein